MEIEDTTIANNIYKRFIFLLILIFSIVTAFIIGLTITLYLQNEHIFKLILTIIIIALLCIALLSLFIIFTVILVWHQRPVPQISKNLLEISLTTIYPIMLRLGGGLKYDKNTIRRAFTELNNKLVFSNKYNIKADKILILTPHCIQKSFCPYKITTSVENCRRCGKCDVDDLIKLKDEFGVNFSVVTGGTLARKVIKEIKPKAIVAIACERDLISGLQDVRKLPIIAVTNKRPEGPCLNTTVDTEEVKIAIKHFICEEW